MHTPLIKRKNFTIQTGKTILITKSNILLEMDNIGMVELANVTNIGLCFIFNFFYGHNLITHAGFIDDTLSS